MAVASYVTGGVGPASNTVALLVTKGLGIGEAVAVTDTTGPAFKGLPRTFELRGRARVFHYRGTKR